MQARQPPLRKRRNYYYGITQSAKRKEQLCGLQDLEKDAGFTLFQLPLTTACLVKIRFKVMATVHSRTRNLYKAGGNKIQETWRRKASHC